jgi:hypothetical protein
LFVTFELVWLGTTTTFLTTVTSKVGIAVTATVGGTVGVAVTVLMIATPCWFSTYVGTAVTAGEGAGNVCTWVHPAINMVEMTASKSNIRVVFFIVGLLKEDSVKYCRIIH